MTFDEYVWRNKISLKDMAEDVGIPYMTLHNVRTGFTVPKLHVALLIWTYTDGKVTFLDMIRAEQRQIVDEYHLKIEEAK